MKYAYYPGCSLHSTGIEYDLSTKAVCKLLNIELEEIADWNCCGASSVHSEERLLGLALPARNLALAEKQGLDTVVPCAACFNRMKKACFAVRECKNTREEVSELIDMDYSASREVIALLDLLANRLKVEDLKEKVVNPFKGVKIASYYGCLLVRPPEITGFDDPENPRSMDNLMEALGGTALDWSFKTECCGGAYSISHPHVAEKMLYRIFDAALAEGADCFTTACPLCFLNLDMRQAEIIQKYDLKRQLPVFYFTEMIGLAIGCSPSELGLEKHFVDTREFLNGFFSGAVREGGK